MSERKFLYGQRVIVRKREIGIIKCGPDTMKERDGYYWVSLPYYTGYDQHLAEHNLEPLPNGQL